LELVVSVKNLEFSYLGSHEKVLRGISFEVHEGELIGVCGPTGCGKSTMFMCLNGLIPHWIKGEVTGEVRVKGLNPQERTIPEMSQVVGMVFQNPETQLFTPAVEREVAFPLENLGIPQKEIKERIDEALEWVGIPHLRKKSPEDLSGGQKQLVAVAATLAMRPSILLLDEPTADLDPVGAEQVLNVIRNLNEKYGITVMIIEHRVDELSEFADKIMLINEGQIVKFDEVHKVFSDWDLVEKVGVRAPRVTESVVKLQRFGIFNKIRGSKMPITVTEAARVYSQLFSKESEINVRDMEKLKKLPAHSFERKKRIDRSKPILSVKNLTFVYPDGTKALNDVSLDIYEQEFIAIIGHNGSGKTTLCKHFLNLLTPTKGEVFVCGNNTKGMKVSRLAEDVGYVFQNPDHQLFADTVKDEVAYGPLNLKMPEEEVLDRVKRSLEVVGAEGLWDEYPRALSRGQRQRVATASTLAMASRILVLDEPTTGQDQRGLKRIMDLILRLNEEGRTIVMITHDMDLVAEYADRVVVMAQGKIIADGPPEEVFTQESILKEANLKPPRINRLARLLTEYGIPQDVTVTDQLISSVAHTLFKRIAG